MSSVPHYFSKGRSGQELGDMKIIDGLVKDGLTNVYNKIHMGVCAEKCASEMKLTREEQDNFAIESYKEVLTHGLKENLLMKLSLWKYLKKRRYYNGY